MMMMLRNSLLLSLWVAFVVVISWADVGLAFCTNKGKSTITRLEVVSGKARKLQQPHVIRGEHYYKNNTSSMPTPKEVAQKLGVKPTKEASNKTWKRAWKLHKRLIPLLHSTDKCKPPDSSLNLICMWLKGLAGNDKSSPVCDDGLAYDLLPSGWRKITKPTRLYPRLHHGNIELRTAYLDQQVTAIAAGKCNTKKIRLVCMGAGYDTRGVKMMERGTVQEVVELDLPEVVSAKERLFGRLLQRRPWLQQSGGSSMPTLVASDFNNAADLEGKLKSLLQSDTNDNDEEWHTIFVFEAVMIYLDQGIPSQLLKITSQVLREQNLDGSLVFADLLENVPGGNHQLGIQELETNGWILEDWTPKPGLARHMGSASLNNTKTTSAAAA